MFSKKCKRCNWEIKELGFSEEERLEIWGLLQQDLKLFAIQRLNQNTNFSLQDAKGIVLHLNKKFGSCIRCDFDKLTEEIVECPKCEAFNYNLKIQTSFSKEFCEQLEFSLDFDDLGKEEVKGFWCDGIDHIPRDIKSLSKRNLEKNKEIITRAWIGKDGQGEYEMRIKFGKQSIENYRENQNLSDCIPRGNFRDWIRIESDKREIQINLT